MKTIIKLNAILITLLVIMLFDTGKTMAQNNYVSYQVFYDQLSPYGQWVRMANYGYVWLPDAEPGFAPYSTSGYWVMTNYGMTWVSNYSWGWAPFHYGRWDYDNFYGWFWVPGHEWGPAWVTWRSANGYYGWAPMQPGITILISFGSHYHSNYHYWRFVRCGDIDRHDLHRYYMRDHDRIIRNSTVINNTYIDNSRHTTYVEGPRRDDIRRNTGRNIRTVSVHENDAPGQEFRNDRLNIYRPKVTENNERNRQSAPSKLADANQIKHRSTNKSVEEGLSNNSQQKRQDNINRSNETKQRINESVNRSNDNYQRQRENNNQANELNRNQQTNQNRSNNNYKKQQDNVNQSNNNRNQTHNNENVQNRNNNTKSNQSGSNRSENQRNTGSEQNNRRK